MHLIPYTEERWRKYYYHMVSSKKLNTIMMLYRHTNNGLYTRWWQCGLHWMSVDLIKENGFTLKKKPTRNRWHPAKTITNTDYVDDSELHVKIPTQVESLLYNQKQAAGGNGFHVNVNKTEFMRFKWVGNISTPSGTSLKLVD